MSNTTIPPYPGTALRFGSIGQNVSIIQQFLNVISDKYTNIPKLRVDGVFGGQTELAIMKFQQQFGLAIDGVVGPLTWAKIMEVYQDVGGFNPPEGTCNYIIQSGDTLWLLAQRFDTTVDELKTLNNLTSNLLMIGQHLLYPCDNPNPPSPPPVIPPSGTWIYTVIPGDTLWAIAKRFCTTVDELKRLNNMISDRIDIGMQLFVPNIKCCE